MLALLALVAGAVDTFGYLSLGQVFISHMTGNTAVAVIALISHHWSEALHRGLAVPSFVLGAAAGGFLVESAGDGRAVARALRSEAALLTLFAAAQWIGHGAAAESEEVGRYALLFVLCAAMGIQNAMLTAAGVRGSHTTHVTGPLTDATVNTVRHRGRHAPVDEVLTQTRQAAARVAGFVVGAACGTALYYTWPLAVPLAAALVLAGLARFERQRPRSAD
jgi:uncharacterized membrane protein YoaK (UPF0700 family)